MLRLHRGYGLNTNIGYGDKSITHRALMLAAIADGSSTLRNALICQDTLSTMRCLEALGAKFQVTGTTIVVTPILTPNSDVTLHCGNSGTTARLLSGLVAGLNVAATFIGDSSLSGRPMNSVVAPLQQMGANVTLGGDGILFSMAKHNGLIAIDYTLPHPSAQVKSAILLAGLFADGTTTVREPSVCRNHTENLLRYVGADIAVSTSAVTVKRSAIKHFNLDIPNDISTAIYMVALGLLSDGATLRNVGLNPTRLGAIKVLQKAGAKIKLTHIHTCAYEQIGDIEVVQSSFDALSGTESDVGTLIDEIPILTMLATRARGISIFRGADDLKNKESDRLLGCVALAKFLGGDGEIQGNDLVIYPATRPVSRAIADTKRDHRMAMCYATAGVLDGDITVNNASCIDISCPQFFDLLGVHMYKLALVGSDVSLSRSPQLYRYFAQQAGVNISYEAYSLAENCPDSELLHIINSHDGVNVTMPFKRRVAQLMHSKADAVNTVTKAVALSTDGTGMLEALKYHNVDIDGKKILVVGAGGTAETAISTLKSSGAEVFVVNRTAAKAEQLSAKYNLKRALPLTFDGIVSCVPACDFEDTISITGAEFVMSVDYKRESVLLKKARAAGITAIDGLPMLFFQGVASFEVFTGVKLNADYNDFLEVKDEIFGD
jgi:3-phosphoshikimate 1-carboxyvinyltransferase